MDAMRRSTRRRLGAETLAGLVLLAACQLSAFSVAQDTLPVGMYVDGSYQCQNKWDIAGTNLVYYSGMGFNDEVCRFLCSELPACTVYVWYSNGVCQIRRDAFRPYHGTTGPNEQIVRSCVKTDIQTLPPPPPPPPSPPPPVWLGDLNGQPPKEDVYLIRAAGPTPRACPDANLITANAYCYWTGQFSLKPFEGAHQAWTVRRTNSSSGSYYVTNYYRQSVASPACERNVWNFQPQCGTTDIDLAAAWGGAQQEVFFEPVAGRRGGVRIRAAGRNCTERYLAAVLACPGYNSLYWAPLNLRDSAFIFEMLPISASYPVPDLPVTPNPSRTPSPSPSPSPSPAPAPIPSPAPASGPGSSPGASPAPASSPAPGGSSPGSSPASSPAPAPTSAPSPAECGRGMLTEAGGFVRSGPPSPSQPQNVVLGLLAVGTYPWFWGKSNVLGVAPDLLYTDCFTQHGLVGPPQYYRVPAKVVPGDSNVYVAKTDRDVFVAVRGTDNDADWVADFVAVWAEANTLFGVTGSSVKLHAGFKDLYVSMADWLIPTVNNTYNSLPPGAKIWITGHSMGGAVAQIASLHIATRLGVDKIGGVVGFASPRAGDSGYRELYNSVLGARHLKFRAGSDPVSNVPPGSLGYTDVGTTVILCPDGVVKTAGPSQPQSAHDDLSCEGLPLSQNFHWPLQYLHGLQRVYGTPCTRAAMELPQCDVRENCRLSTDSYKDYCTACTQPGDCDYYGLQGHYCDNIVPVASSFTCKPKAPVGTVCLYDRVCGSGHCVAGFCRACGEDKHCAAGEFCELSVLQPTSLWTCKSDLAVSSPCERDSQCGSGVCDRLACRECRSDAQCNAPGESGRFCDTNPLLIDNTYGKCRWPKPTGSMCTADRECGSGHCVTGFCRACNADAHCGDGAWCELAVLLQPTTAWTCKAPQSNGSPCERDTQCGSGHCVGLFCQECGSSDHCAPGQYCDVTSLFKCRDLKPDGSICLADAQCASGHCHLGGCRTCVSDNHCAPDQFCELFDITKLYTCRGDMGRGSPCDRNSQCTSGKCDGIPLFKKCT